MTWPLRWHHHHRCHDLQDGGALPSRTPRLGTTEAHALRTRGQRFHWTAAASLRLHWAHLDWKAGRLGGGRELLVKYHQPMAWHVCMIDMIVYVFNTYLLIDCCLFIHIYSLKC